VTAMRDSTARLDLLDPEDPTIHEQLVAAGLVGPHRSSSLPARASW
jgi:hypothetical protein